MKPTGQQIQDIIGQVTELTWSYAIWWELVNKTNRIDFSKAFEAFPNYFTATFCSMQQGMFVIVARLFDERQDVVSLINLVKNLRASDPHLAGQLTSEMNQNWSIIKKCQKLRHKVYGHRDLSSSPQKAFQDLPIKPKDLKTILKSIQSLTAALAEAEGKNSRVSVLDNFEHCEADAACEAKMILQYIAHR